MEKQLKQIVKDFKTVLPNFRYENGIACEISVENDLMEVCYDINGVISISCKVNMDITTDFVDDMINLLSNLLENEIEKNKNSYYKYKYYYNE